MFHSKRAMEKAIHDTLRRWHRLDSKLPLEQLYLVNQWPEEKRMLLNDGGESAVVKSIVRFYIEKMKSEPKTKQLGHILTRRFLEGVGTKTIAYDHGKSVDQINRVQKKAMATLTELVWEAEEQALHALKIRQLGNLDPKTYQELIGVEGTKSALLTALADTEDRRTINLVGLGGLGKSALADAVCRDLSEGLQFEHIFWVKVPSVRMIPEANEVVYAALLGSINDQLSGEYADHDASNHERIVRDYLQQKQCLLVIDNVEASEHLHFLIQKLGDLSPSKILITSRARFVGQAGVNQILLEELQESDAFALIRHWADHRGQTELAEADKPTLQAIYDVTGGNPLALKLVVGLTTYNLPLVATLTGLRAGREGEAKDLYTRIYWYAWHQLDPSAQRVLKAMLLSGIRGTKSGRLQQQTKLEDAVYWQSVNDLLKLSLLETAGTPLEPRYSIHQLTASFLNTEIVRPKGGGKK